MEESFTPPNVFGQHPGCNNVSGVFNHQENEPDDSMLIDPEESPIYVHNHEGANFHQNRTLCSPAPSPVSSDVIDWDDDDLYEPLPGVGNTSCMHRTVSSSPYPTIPTIIGEGRSEVNMPGEASGESAETSSITEEMESPTRDPYPYRTHTVDANSTPPGPQMDLALCVKGMYRILDLISEQGSGGLVDKVIIAQDSLRDFINALYPGAYVSLTNVNFKILDDLAVKPVGVYGSRAEIVRFLYSIGAVGDEEASLLLSSTDGSSQPNLRSGLYIVRPFNMAEPTATNDNTYLVYWPEDTTWNDDAVSSVRRNRVTFMRYLTKITDQVIAFISEDDARTIVWRRDGDEVSMDADNEETDRLFTYEVAKTHEQEENVVSRTGFQISSSLLATQEPPLDCPIDPVRLKPKLLAGEMSQAILTTKYIPNQIHSEAITRGTINPALIRELLKGSSLKIRGELSDEAVTVLIKYGLGTRFPKECSEWRERKELSAKNRESTVKEEEAKIIENLQSESSRLEIALYYAIADIVLGKFQTLTRNDLECPQVAGGHTQIDEYIAHQSALHPRIKDELREAIRNTALDAPLPPPFKNQKLRLITIDFLLRERKDLNQETRQKLIDIVCHGKDIREVQKVLDVSTEDSRKSTKFWPTLRDWLRTADPSVEDELFKTARQLATNTTDSDFLTQLPDMVARHPALERFATATQFAAHSHFQRKIHKTLKTLLHRVYFIQEDDFKKEVKRSASHRENEELKQSRRMFFHQLEESSQSTSFSQTVVLESFEVMKMYGYSSRESYKATGRREALLPPSLQYTIHALGLTADHRQNLQLNPAFIPSPHIEKRLSHSFMLDVNFEILHAQLLSNDKLLLLIDDRRGNLIVFLDRPCAMDGAIKNQLYKKVLHRDKIGEDFVLAFDEVRRMLAVCGSSKLQLHVFVFDETFASLQAFGSAVNLTRWYPSYGSVSITHACFVSGSEEIMLIGTDGQARIFSLVTQQFRPASLQLNERPNAVYSSPDGSCLFLSNTCESGLSLRAYHWSTFGCTNGIHLDLPTMSADGCVITAFVNRSSIHFIGLDHGAHRCQSVALDITRKATELMFKAKGVHARSGGGAVSTLHNSIIDCHGEVWTRFPVLPAVRRQTIVSSNERRPKALLFIADRDHDEFRPYFSYLIQAFETSTRKPTGDELETIHVSAMKFDDFMNSEIKTSSFRAGEWLVDLLCLIPIHLAITRENRFVPLKDGVSSAELEKSLLGAEVGAIVDSLSFGWYESLFQSYMVSKPVKVVSSMGEQSVGKSFALNHLVDTSFAGSAMRTTEGVWMSVTPTEENLIVALDFEGVHSIERSTQEDTLLVLFNTAISNLVLFRNNFALSRDITGLFQSFQSSSTVLDPAANPSLFQSTLVIIIKDVIDSDKAEIAKEFSLKFQQIVQDEQEANFLSRLHAGKLNIIPWPVIESKQFYSLFPTLKRQLDQQRITHPAAGEFLHTLKTLMAKLKANDWGALSQTLAAHRSQRLLLLLPNALAFGYAELEPHTEDLKNFDTNEIIGEPDTDARFFLQRIAGETITRETTLATLREAWQRDHPRHLTTDLQWNSDLSRHLDDLIDTRVAHVQEWISSNISRFKATHAGIEELRRTFEAAKVDLRANVQLCKMQCARCQLLCVCSRLHDGLHHCQTSHRCIHSCDFAEDHPEEQKACGHPAGHSGKHICAVTAHLCGEPCQLVGKPGCLQQCAKVAGHAEEDHICSASVHTCGEPCGLNNIRLANGSSYSCIGYCSIPSHEVHTLHVCDNRMCPVTCQLCKRLCSVQDHLHGLDNMAIHLCGQEHPCSALCSADGICEIETAPQSVEATFTGRHETFQYTKYSQVAKRVKCVVPIGAQAIAHPGQHSHSMDQNPFHYCETSCENCGYFCTLPRGHAQQEHETCHGSMSKTRWVVDGPDGTHLELGGRKFASNDDGAPMMCNLICQSMGRHAHIDYCRTEAGIRCGAADLEHISARLAPSPDRPKDWITHSLYWRRTGFKDPYSQDERTNFAKCDAMCRGREHTATATAPAQLSHCTLPMFHPRQAANAGPAGGLGYVSDDGHSFACRNPVVMQQAFHIMFVIDRSGSMDCSDRRPLPNSPGTNLISRTCNNRLGAVYSALHAFWMSRNAATAAGARRDAYSILLFDHDVSTGVANNFTSNPDELLNIVLAYHARGGTNFVAAVTSAQALMQRHWHTERTPVIIFLSDGECTISDQTMQDLCRTSVRLGKPLSFHAVSFGPDRASSSLRRMAQIALDIQRNAPRDPLTPAAAMVESSFSVALDTVRLAETFLGIAESLRKPRGSLFR